MASLLGQQRGSHETLVAQTEIFSAYNSLKVDISKIRASSLYTQLRELLHLITVVASDFATESKDEPVIKCRNSVLNALGAVQHQLDELFARHRETDAVTLAIAVRDLYLRLDLLRWVLASIIEFSLPESNTTVGGIDRLILKFSEHLSLPEIATKLLSLDECYTILSDELEIDDPPLKLHRVSAGSVIFEVTGAATILLILKPLIIELGKFLYRNVTAEGRIEAFLARGQASLDLQERLIDRLQKRGLPVEEARSQMHRTATVLATAAEKLVATGELTEVDNEVVNGVVLQISTPNQKQLPEPPAK